MPIDSATWITRETTTFKHLQGLIEGLKATGEVLDYAQIRIMTVPGDLTGGVSLPGALFPDGEDRVFTDETLPAEGLLFLPN